MPPPASFQVINDMVANVKDANKTKVDKVASMRKKEELDDIKKLAELEKRAQAAEKNRSHVLSVKSSTKKRQLSPRLSPTSKIEIESKINEAAERRELYLVSIPLVFFGATVSSNLCSTDKPGREGKGQVLQDHSLQHKAQPRPFLRPVSE